MTVELGDRAKDTVTGFVGIVLARTIWLQGCDRIVLQPAVGKDGKIPDTATFDEPQLVVVKKAVIVAPNKAPQAERVNNRGGPRDDLAATRRND